MQTNLPDDAVPLIQQKSSRGWFSRSDRCLRGPFIATDQVKDYGAPSELSFVGKGRDDVEAMITAGLESGDATPMTDADWKHLHDRIEQRGG